MFSCTHCEKEFTIKSRLMNHRKQEHKNKIKVCINSTNGLCKFESDCWYKHEDIENENININGSKNQEIFDKIFDMMEKCTNRIVNIEIKC